MHRGPRSPLKNNSHKPWSRVCNKHTFYTGPWLWKANRIDYWVSDQTWFRTATEPKNRKRDHAGVIPHFLLTIVYVMAHTLLVLVQATCLNVAINASNKALLTIMISNNFIEIKGSVFKSFNKKNLFQVSCSDVRERFHLFALLFIVVVQTMKEYSWKEESFWSLAPDCLLVLCSEFFVDWIKHAFITRSGR